MAKHNECVQAILDELDKYGLAGQVTERGKHLEIAWQTPSGGRRSRFTAATPSDWRAQWRALSVVRANDPEWRKKHSVRVKAKWEDPKWRKYVIKRQKEGRLAKKARESCLSTGLVSSTNIELSTPHRGKMLVRITPP